jgi:hypothetical protein
MNVLSGDGPVAWGWSTRWRKGRLVTSLSPWTTPDAGGHHETGTSSKIVLVLVGLLFTAGLYPLAIAVRSELDPNIENALPMMLSLYVTLGVFLLLAARNPSAHRSVIAFAAWSSFAHASVMAVMSIQLPTERAELLIAAAAFSIIGVLLIVLAPGRQPPARVQAAG